MTRSDSTSTVGVLEIGGSHVTAALVHGSTPAVDPDTVCRYPIDPAGSLDELIGAFAAALDGATAPAGTPWAVAVPGPFDYAKGIGWYRGVGKFDSLYGVDVRAAIAAKAGQHPERLEFVNDADAFAIGEWHSGVGDRAARCVGITLGSGVGSAFLADGVPVASGPQVPPDGEVHLLQVGGHDLEDIVSRRAILARYRSRPVTDPVDGKDQAAIDVADVFARARRADAWAELVLREAFRELGGALAPWLRSFGAQAVMVGGAMTGGWDIVEPALSAGIDLDIPVRRSADPVRSALVGAAVHLRAG